MPTAITPEGMSFVTTLPLPITTLLPMVTPERRGHAAVFAERADDLFQELCLSLCLGRTRVVEIEAEILAPHAFGFKLFVVIGVVEDACKHLFLLGHELRLSLE